VCEESRIAVSIFRISAVACITARAKHHRIAKLDALRSPKAAWRGGGSYRVTWRAGLWFTQHTERIWNASFNLDLKEALCVHCRPCCC
jgi:hypothetical protein